MNHFYRSLCMLSLLCFVTLAQEPNWNQWRGPNSTNHSFSSGIAKSWPAEGPTLLWKIEGIGSGYSSVTFYGDKMFTMGDISGEGGAQCYVFALERDSGKEIWKTAIGRGGDGGGNWPGTLGTPACDGETVYAMSQFGELAALDANTGTIRWKKNTPQELGAQKMSGWGYSMSPIIDGDKIVIPIGGEGGTLAAFSKSGELLWRTAELKDSASYSSAVPVEIAGIRQYLLLTGGAGGGGGRGGRGGRDAPPEPVDPALSSKLVGISTDGKVLWQTPFRGRQAIASDPVLCGDVIIAGCGYNVGADFYRIAKEGDTFKVEKFREDESLPSHHGGIVAVGDHFYYLADRKGLVCVEAKTGNLVWESRSVVKGSLTYADGMLILRAEAGDGTVALVEATPEGYKELGKFNPPNRSDRNSWAYPVVVDKKLYLRDQNVLLCYDLK